MKWIICFFGAMTLIGTTHADGDSIDIGKKNENKYGWDILTKPFWNIDKTYRLRFDENKIRGRNDSCETPKKAGDTEYYAGKESIFKEIRSTDKFKVVEFIYVSQKDSSSKVSKAELNQAYKICISDKIVPDYNVKRAGGMNTGILVVPFKLRSGSIFSDSTIGPYVSFSGSKFSLLATAGLTQVTVIDVSNTGDVKTETGVSVALGTVWSIDSEFDISFVVGVDHLSGSVGDNFKYQDKPWVSFGIGFNFTQ